MTSPKRYDIRCPHCGSGLKIAAKFSGLRPICPRCRKRFLLPKLPADAHHERLKSLKIPPENLN